MSRGSVPAGPAGTDTSPPRGAMRRWDLLLGAVHRDRITFQGCNNGPSCFRYATWTVSLRD